MLQDIHDRLTAAKQPEEVFGGIDDAKDKYRELAKVCHPDSYTDPTGKYLANRTIPLLNALWEQAERKMNDGTYGDLRATPSAPASSASFTVGKMTYTLGNKLHEGDTASLFEAVVATPSSAVPVLLKIPHGAATNPLMEREAKNIKQIEQRLLQADDEMRKKFGTRYPKLIQSFKLDDGEERIVNAFERVPTPERWFTLEEIHAAHPVLNPRQVAFIWRRILEALTIPHLEGLAHGAVTPNHVLIQADDHSGMLVDWTWCATAVKGVQPRYLPYAAPEVTTTGGAQSSDIYSAAKCVIYLLGGDPVQNEIQHGLETPIKNLLNKCLQPRPRFRPQNARSCYELLDKALTECFGPRKFVDLTMPARK